MDLSAEGQRTESDSGANNAKNVFSVRLEAAREWLRKTTATDWLMVFITAIIGYYAYRSYQGYVIENRPYVFPSSPAICGSIRRGTHGRFYVY